MKTRQHRASISVSDWSQVQQHLPAVPVRLRRDGCDNRRCIGHRRCARDRLSGHSIGSMARMSSAKSAASPIVLITSALSLIPMKRPVPSTVQDRQWQQGLLPLIDRLEQDFTADPRRFTRCDDQPAGRHQPPSLIEITA